MSDPINALPPTHAEVQADRRERMDAPNPRQLSHKLVGNRLEATVRLINENRALQEEVDRLARFVTQLQDRLPRETERYVLLSDLLVAQLLAAPSSPVTVQVFEHDGGRLELSLARHFCAGGAS